MAWSKSCPFSILLSFLTSVVQKEGNLNLEASSSSTCPCDAELFLETVENTGREMQGLCYPDAFIKIFFFFLHYHLTVMEEYNALDSATEYKIGLS